MLFVLISGFVFSNVKASDSAKEKEAFFNAPNQVFESSNKNIRNINTLEPSLVSSLARGGGSITVSDFAMVPETGVEGTYVELEERNRNGQINVYEVRNGDSLSQIAEMFGVSVNTIRWANELDGAIQPGDKLIILPVSGLKYKITKGDTLESLAKKFNASNEEIARYNGLSLGAELAVGSEIVIPNAEIKEEKKSNKSGSTKSKTGKVVTSSSGYYTNPVPGSVLTQGLHGYNAVDLGAPIGTTVRASASGKVIISKLSGWNGGYGEYIVISHDNGTQTLYSHLNNGYVVEGQYVEKGEAIGEVGSTGKSTGPHLHFEVRGATNPFAR